MDFPMDFSMDFPMDFHWIFQWIFHWIFQWIPVRTNNRIFLCCLLSFCFPFFSCFWVIQKITKNRQGDVYIIISSPKQFCFAHFGATSEPLSNYFQLPQNFPRTPIELPWTPLEVPLKSPCSPLASGQAAKMPTEIATKFLTVLGSQNAPKSLPKSLPKLKKNHNRVRLRFRDVFFHFSE